MSTDQPKQSPDDQSFPQTFLFYNMLIDKIVKNMGRASDRKEEPEKILAEVKEQYNPRAHFARLISATYPDQQEDKEGEGTKLLELESNKEIFKKREYELFEQQCIWKKLMRTILATYPPVLDEQDSTKFSNK